MNNDWRKYVQTDEEFAKNNEDDENSRKVLQEEFDFLAKNWHWYLVAAGLSFVVVAFFVLMLLSLLNLVLGGTW